MALPLRLSRCSRTTLTSPRLSRLSYSSSSSDGGGGGGGGGEDDKNPPPPTPPPPSSYSSYFSDVKASLRQSPPSPPRKPPTAAFRSPVQPSLLSPKPSKIASLDEIRKNLSEFRRRSAAPSQGSSSPPPVSFSDIYNSKLIGKPAEDAAAADTKTTSFNSIRESLRQLRSSNPPSPMNRSRGSETLSPYSLQSFKNSLNLKPPSEGSGTSAPLLGGPDSQLPSFIFGREMGEKREPESQALKTEFVKMYRNGELGEKLKMLRPAAATAGKKDWFSLGELNERLMKLREMEKETESRIGGVSFKDLRDSLVRLRKSSDESSKKSNMQRLAILRSTRRAGYT